MSKERAFVPLFLGRVQNAIGKFKKAACEHVGAPTAISWEPYLSDNGFCRHRLAIAAEACDPFVQKLRLFLQNEFDLQPDAVTIARAKQSLPDFDRSVGVIAGSTCDGTRN